MDLRRSAWIVALCVLCLIVTSGLVAAEDTAQPAERTEHALKYDPDFPDSMVVATVNSAPITAGEVLEPYKNYLAHTVKPRVSAEKYGEIRQAWVKQHLSAVIERKLLVQALLADLTEDQRKALEEYVEEGWSKYTVELRGKLEVSTMAELVDKLKEEGVELASVKRNWREGSMAHQYKLLKPIPPSSYEPTSKELREYYDEHEFEWEFPTRVKWQEIVVGPQPEEGLALAKSRAEKLLKKLKGGADFAELARASSDGLTSEDGGNRGWLQSDAIACGEVGVFLSTSKIGSISHVIRCVDEFHIVKLIHRQEAGHESFDEVKSKIRETLKQADRERREREARRELAGKAVVKSVFGDEWKFEAP